MRRDRDGGAARAQGLALSVQRRRGKSKVFWPPFRGSRKHRASRTSWGRVALLFLIGVTVSLQIGKVPGELPAIETELGLTLFDIGSSSRSSASSPRSAASSSARSRIASAACASRSRGLRSAGPRASRAPSRRAPFRCSRAASSRVWASSSRPPRRRRSSPMRRAPSDRGKALGLWGMYMPAGMSTMMLIAALLAGAWSWRQLWQATALLQSRLTRPWSGSPFAGASRQRRRHGRRSQSRCASGTG